MTDQMHFDDAHGTYLDFGNHTEKVLLLYYHCLHNMTLIKLSPRNQLLIGGMAVNMNS